MDVLRRHLPRPRRERGRGGGNAAAPQAGAGPRANQIIRGGGDQVARRLAVAAMLAVAAPMAGSSTALAAPAAAPPTADRNAFERQLAKECTALTAVAIKASYGWGWADAKPAAAPTRRPAKAARGGGGGGGGGGQRNNEIDVRQTAATGLVLYLAGEQLGDPNLTKAAAEAARVVAAVQQPTGQMPAVGILGANPGGRDEPAVVPARAATCAALALLSTVIQGSETPDPRLTQSAVKAATWLSTQQTKAGAWPVAHAPPGAKEPAKLVRLDTPDYRDATAALLLVAQATGDASAARRAEDAVTALLAMRVRAGDDPGGVLWVPGYRLTGQPLPKESDLPYALDTVAAQYAMQTLLAACLLGSDATNAAGEPRAGARTAAPALVAAGKMVESLPRKAGGWHRYYDLLAQAPIPELEPKAGLRPGGGGESLSASEDDAAAAAATADAAALSEAVAAAREIETVGLERYLADADADAESALFWPQHRVGLMLCGLGSDVPATRLSKTAAEVEAYLKANEELWKFIDGAVPGDLPTRIKRLQLLLIRAKLEHLK